MLEINPPLESAGSGPNGGDNVAMMPACAADGSLCVFNPGKFQNKLYILSLLVYGCIFVFY